MTSAAASRPEPTSLSPWRATWDALCNRDAAYFPRIEGADGQPSRITDAVVIAKAAEALQHLSPPQEELEEVFSRARETLDEVKGLTEYQDGKATRLLTIITFLSALSGILFGQLATAYPLLAAIARPDARWWDVSLVIGAYLGFAVFALLAICGALVTFHAIRSRFRYPAAPLPGRAKSFLFYRSILEVPPGEWAGSFVRSTDRTKLARDLKLKYFRNYVVESYLIAAKVADKVRYLEPAQSLQSYAIRMLVAWLVVFALTIAVVPPVEKPTVIQIIPAPNPANSLLFVKPPSADHLCVPLHPGPPSWSWLYSESCDKPSH